MWFCRVSRSTTPFLVLKDKSVNIFCFLPDNSRMRKPQTRTVNGIMPVRWLFHPTATTYLPYESWNFIARVFFKILFEASEIQSLPWFIMPRISRVTQWWSGNSWKSVSNFCLPSRNKIDYMILWWRIPFYKSYRKSRKNCSKLSWILIEYGNKLNVLRDQIKQFAFR